MKKYFFRKLDKQSLEDLCKRPAINVSAADVKPILEAVKTRGDEAVREFSAEFDGVNTSSLEVEAAEIEAACGRVDESLKSAFELAAANIRRFHEAQIPRRIELETMPGVRCWREARSIERVGLYVPGGSAPLPSTVLMLGIPAQIAGCGEVVLCTPPEPADAVLFAARLAGIDRVFRIGGAQAIAAMAYGTESVPKVDKIFGPGNQYVTAAKMLASCDGIAIDMPAGPSEVLVIADELTRADFVAADLLSQAEHGADSQVVLVSDCEAKIDEVLEELKKQVVSLPRRNIVEKALKKSFALVVENLEQAVEFSNQYAPEHLILNVVGDYADKVQNAGSVFIGQYSCEAAGDYASGTNHTLPTYGYAKSYSGVSVESFLKQITFQQINADGVAGLGAAVELMAQCEGLEAHKRAMTLRINAIS